MDEMKDPITLDFTATQAPAEDAPVGQKALDSERPPVRVVLLALDQVFSRAAQSGARSSSSQSS